MPHLINWGKFRYPSPRHPWIHGADMTDASAYSSNPKKSCWTNNLLLKATFTLGENRSSVLCQSRRQLTLTGKKKKKTLNEVGTLHHLLLSGLWKSSNVDFKTMALSQSQINVWAVASFSCGTLRSRERPPAEQAALTAFLKAKCQSNRLL